MKSYVLHNQTTGLSNSIFCRFEQRTLTVGGRITEQLVSSLTRLELTNEGNIILLYLVKQSNATL